MREWTRGGRAEFEVTLSGASDRAVTVEYGTVAGTAVAGLDYTAAAGTLTFEAGERRATIEVATIEDDLAESDEAFTVELRAPSGATLRDDTGTGTIIDDDTDTGTGDALPELSIADATAEEGETVELAVTLSKASADVVTVMYWTVGGTAVVGSDYTAATGTLTFLAGRQAGGDRGSDDGGRVGGVGRGVHGRVEGTEWGDVARRHGNGDDH